MSETPDLPIAAITKSARERIAITLRSFKGHRFVDVRLQYADGDEWKWTPKGVGVRPDLIDELVEALSRAREAAHEEGLV